MNHRFSSDSDEQIYGKSTKGMVERELIEDFENEVTEAYEQFNPNFHISRQTKYLTLRFLKKYIAYSK